jgi:hypothetical protein
MRNILIASASLLALGGAAQAANFAPADFLAENCTRCHDERVYTRPDRRVQNLQQLEAQVRRCDANFGTRLFDEDIATLVQYLNAKHYKF